MLYSLYELGHWSVAPWRFAALMQSRFLRSPLNPAGGSEAARTAAAASDLFESMTRRYLKPAWNLASTIINDVEVPVTVRDAWSSPWCRLLHFERGVDARRSDPSVLIVAPMSGHYATLLRGTVEAFLPEHEVYVTDWSDARMAPLFAGRFDLNDYIDHVIDMLRALGPDTHVVAVCQPGPAVVAAISLMAQAGDPCTPASMTIMGSPIDARRSPTAPNKLAEGRQIDWFRENMIHTVPAPYPGMFRRVYPGFLQLMSFMGMNLSRHVDAHHSYFQNLVKGDGDDARRHREFYDEYLAVMDLTEEFYIQTLIEVFQDYTLANGTMRHRGERVDPSAITSTALLTIEGENDDISGIGQTQAAHDICVNIPDAMQRDYIQPGVGHYGVFSGRRFRTEIYPRIRSFIREFATQASRKAATTRARLRLVSKH
jgi:poly(3-hydroxybutyrate) depolymerase